MGAHWGTRILCLPLIWAKWAVIWAGLYPKRIKKVSFKYPNYFISFIHGYSLDTYRGRIGSVSVSDTVSDTDSLVA